MQCYEFESVLDERGLDAASRGELEALEAHAAECGDCAAELAAVRALAHDPVPAVARELDPAMLGPEPEPGDAPGGRRRAARVGRAGMLLGVLGLGGAAFAGVAMYTAGMIGGDDRTPESRASGAELTEEDAGTAEAAVRAFDGTPDPVRRAAAEERAAYEALSSEVMGASGLPDGEYFALLRIPPAYPPAALEQELEGSVVLEYTVTAEGSIADAAVVESSDPVFEASALETARKFKYKPRIESGRPVAVEGARMVMRFALERPVPEDESGPRGEAGSSNTSDDAAAGSDESRSAAASAELHRAWVRLDECLTADDLDCLEFVLDEVLVTHSLSPAEKARFQRIYGFVHFRRGSYQRAIDAYEESVRLSEESGSADPLSLITIARIHYRRHEYQPALDYAIEYLKAIDQPAPADYVFVDRLRQLGATVR